MQGNNENDGSSKGTLSEWFKGLIFLLEAIFGLILAIVSLIIVFVNGFFGKALAIFALIGFGFFFLGIDLEQKKFSLRLVRKRVDEKLKDLKFWFDRKTVSVDRRLVVLACIGILSFIFFPGISQLIKDAWNLSLTTVKDIISLTSGGNIPENRYFKSIGVAVLFLFSMVVVQFLILLSYMNSIRNARFYEGYFDEILSQKIHDEWLNFFDWMKRLDSGFSDFYANPYHGMVPLHDSHWEADSEKVFQYSLEAIIGILDDFEFISYSSQDSKRQVEIGIFSPRAKEELELKGCFLHKALNKYIAQEILHVRGKYSEQNLIESLVPVPMTRQEFKAISDRKWH
jgi:hypothetical protein